MITNVAIYIMRKMTSVRHLVLTQAEHMLTVCKITRGDVVVTKGLVIQYVKQFPFMSLCSPI